MFAWQFYLTYGVLGNAHLGSVSQKVTGVIVAKWFMAKRGRALGFASTGVSLGSLLGVAIATFAIAVVGWRGRFMVMGCSSSDW